MSAPPPYLLFRLWAVDQGVGSIVVLPFAEIMPAVRDGLVDAGLVIHEARFTYGAYGLTSLVDLGDWWESDTGLPIPLGAILARRALGAAAIEALTAAIRSSVELAWKDPAASAGYVAEHADEMDPDVQQRHIALYVNEFTAATSARTATRRSRPCSAGQPQQVSYRRSTRPACTEKSARAPAPSHPAERFALPAGSGQRKAEHKGAPTRSRRPRAGSGHRRGQASSSEAIERRISAICLPVLRSG